MLWAASCKCSHQQLKLLKVFKGSPYLRNHPWNKMTFFFWYFWHPSTLYRQIFILQGILFTLSKFSWILSRDMSLILFHQKRKDIISQLSSRINALIFDLLILNQYVRTYSSSFDVILIDLAREYWFSVESLCLNARKIVAIHT